MLYGGHVWRRHRAVRHYDGAAAAGVASVPPLFHTVVLTSRTSDGERIHGAQHMANVAMTVTPSFPTASTCHTPQQELNHLESFFESSGSGFTNVVTSRTVQ